MKTRQITEALELDIIFGRIKPRERLIEDDLVARFQAKRHVVRSALVELERIGIVERKPNRGASVRDYSRDEIDELYDLRAELHRLAIARLPLPFDPVRLGKLRDIQRGHAKAVARGDLKAVYELNNAFHDTLFDACGNRYLADAIRDHAALAHAVRSYRIADPALLAQAREEHDQMLDALEKGDRARLADLAVGHIQPSKQAYLDGLGIAGTLPASA